MGRRKIIDMGANLHKYKPAMTAVDTSVGKIVGMRVDIETVDEISTVPVDVYAGLTKVMKDRRAVISEGVRRAGKSMVMGMAYGGRLRENLQQTLTERFSAEAHPLRYLGGYKHLPQDPRLAGAHLYKTNNQNMSGIISKGLLVPHTTLNYHLLTTLKPIGSVPALETEPTVPVIAWCRRHTVCELTDAIATLQMMGHDSIAVVRAFEP